MSSNMREVLEQVERGELDSATAARMISGEKERPGSRDSQFLVVRVNRLHDQQPRVNVRIPLQWVELGLSLGARYAPELDELDFQQIIEGIHEVSEGTIVEVEDIEDDQHVVVCIERE
jgi:hypothetical protein